MSCLLTEANEILNYNFEESIIIAATLLAALLKYTLCSPLSQHLPPAYEDAR